MRDMRQLAMESRSRGIRANSIAPGVFRNRPGARPVEVPGLGGLHAWPTLSGRLGRPRKWLRVALLLASDDSWLRDGVDIVVDGGMCP